MAWKFKLTKEDKAKWYAQLIETEKFCKQHDILTKNTTFFKFQVNGIFYIVVADRFLYRYFNQTKGKENSEECRIDVVIWAGKQRIQEIYNNALQGKEMDEKGRVIGK